MPMQAVRVAVAAAPSGSDSDLADLADCAAHIATTFFPDGLVILSVTTWSGHNWEIISKS